MLKKQVLFQLNMIKERKEIMHPWEFTKAVKLLQRYIDDKIQHVPYSVSNDSPSTYKALRESYDRSGLFVVNGNANDKTIFDSPDYNIKFRAIHDSMHYHLNLSFEYSQEKELSDHTVYDFFMWATEQEGLRFRLTLAEIFATIRVIDAEIRGQIEYYQANNDYVIDQAAYTMDYVNVV